MTHDLVNRFSYHPPFGDQTKRYEAIRATALELAKLIDAAVSDCREKATALTQLETCVMWANAGIARNEKPVAP